MIVCCGKPIQAYLSAYARTQTQTMAHTEHSVDRMNGSHLRPRVILRGTCARPRQSSELAERPQMGHMANLVSASCCVRAFVSNCERARGLVSPIE